MKEITVIYDSLRKIYLQVLQNFIFVKLISFFPNIFLYDKILQAEESDLDDFVDEFVWADL